MADRIVVARHGAGQETPQRGGRRPAPRHFLYVGDAEPRKNVGLLLAAHRIYCERAAEPLPLVLAGSLPGDLADHAHGVTVELRPSAERLAELYRGAAALVHPALHEGFGMTPLEAMSSGTPVLAARSPGVAEVCGDAVRYFDPLGAEALAGALAELLADDGQRRDLAERGRRRAAEFSWARSARDHLRAYTLAAT
jgi:alpha-1,3-rhamnosyl/mannosyltransferase